MDPQSIGRLDPDPDAGGLKRAKMKGKNADIRQIIRHKKYKIILIGTYIKMFIVTLFH
jgi:hypothetical protein